MRKCLLVLGLLSTLFVNAQTKKVTPKKKNVKAEKAVKAAPVEDVAIPIEEEVIFEAPKEERIEETKIMVAEEPARRPENTPNVVDGEPFYIYSSNSEKNITIAYMGNDNSYSNRRFGLLEYYSKKKLTPFVFESISGFYESDLSIVRLNGKNGLMNTKGQIIVPCIYDDMNTITVDGIMYYIVSKNGRFGVINAQNESIIPFEYDNISKQYNANVYLEVTKSGKSGLMNFVSRKEVIPVMYDRIHVQSANLVMVRKGNLNTLFNLTGEKALSNWYTQLDVINDNELAIAELYGKKGLIGMDDRKIIPLEYDVLNRMRSGYASRSLFIAAKGGKYGLLGADGKVALPLQYDMISSISNDMICVSKNNKKGILMIDGKVVIPVEYDDLTDGDKYFLVKKNNKYGVIARDGNTILPVEYDALNRISIADSYNSPYLVGAKNGKKGMVDGVTGKARIEFIYDDLIGTRRNSYSSTESFNNSIIAVKNNKYGVIEMNGEVALPFVYDDLQYLNSFLVIAGKNGKYGVVDIYNNNNVVLPFEYQFVSHKSGTIIAYKDSYEKFRVSSNKITKVGN
ncbi:WG repeat-containing protein [Niastella caeni]|uniref:WG repeat-containing protein n=1 Tax=Niastella caeni TaxID=2569763 RepID=A0A4S8HZT5_9BACT|nr:WG repeat-containing protein [Niastella caeni]THU41267.1 WG repeat-containing protein [Niastella caeni]